MKWVTCLLVFAVAAAFSGCVELTGQRISWFHDVAHDRLDVLIFYDGVHEGVGQDASEHGEQQIPKFIRDGDVMLADWFGQLEWKSWRAAASKLGPDTPKKQLAEAMGRVTTRSLGYYKEPDTRIGAAQWVRIEKVSELIAALNRVIDSEVLEKNSSTSSGRSRPSQMAIAAKRGYTWVQLDGQAIRLSLPLSPREVAKSKGEFVSNLLHALSNPEAGRHELLAMLFRGLASVPFSYRETAEGVELVIGRVDATSTVRLHVREAYEPSLEPVVKREVPAELGEVLRGARSGANRDPGIAAVVRFGPAEAQVLALLDRKDVAGLKKWGETWDAGEGWPEAPKAAVDDAAYLESWRGWYTRMKRYPLR